MRGNHNVKYIESSDDDDFARADSVDRGSPAFSRLKRQRRSSREKRAEKAVGLSPSSLQDDEVICIPESVDEQDNQTTETPAVTIRSLPVAAKAEEKAVVPPSDVESGYLVNDDSRDASRDGSIDIGVDPVGHKESPCRTNDNKRKVESDSESEPSDDDEDEYNADDDSPDEDGGDSDFEIEVLPKKPARKKQTKALAKPSRAPAKKARSAATTTRKVATAAKPATKNTSVPKTNASDENTGSSKKRLGARIPHRSSSLVKLQGRADSRARPTPLNKGPTTVFRAGLSRNAAIPKLHAYLHK